MRLLLCAVAIVGLVATAGCGPTTAAPAGSAPSSAPASGTASAGAGCQQVGSVSFDKTKFVLHAGLAFGAFHHFIYNPFKAGQLHGVLALGKAGLAGLFTVHELKLAKADAESSPTLCHLAAPFDAASAGLSGLLDKIKGGTATPQDVSSLENEVDAVQNGSAADGVTVPDQVPSDGQLASGGN